MMMLLIRICHLQNTTAGPLKPKQKIKGSKGNVSSRDLVKKKKS